MAINNFYPTSDVEQNVQFYNYNGGSPAIKTYAEGGYLYTSATVPELDAASNKILISREYVDDEIAAAVQGLSLKVAVKVASIGSQALTPSGIDYDMTGFINTSKIDNQVLVAGGTEATSDRFLLKNQSSPSENGIYYVVSYAPDALIRRCSDSNGTGELDNAFVFVETGDNNQNTGWVQITEDVVPGTTSQTWTQFSGAGSYTAGIGLTRIGTEFSITTLTENRALITNGSGELSVSAITTTELGYLDTVSSNIQTQINNKLFSNQPDDMTEILTMKATLIMNTLGIGAVNYNSETLNFLSNSTAGPVSKDMYTDYLGALHFDSDIIAMVDDIPASFSISAASDILIATGGSNSTSYNVATARTAGKFYRHATNPTATTGAEVNAVKYEGWLYATQFEGTVDGGDWE